MTAPPLKICMLSWVCVSWDVIHYDLHPNIRHTPMESNGCGGADASPSASLQHHNQPPMEERCTCGSGSDGGAARAAVVPQQRHLAGGRPTFRYPPARSALSVRSLLEISEDLRRHPLVRGSLCLWASSGHIHGAAAADSGCSRKATILFSSRPVSYLPI